MPRETSDDSMDSRDPRWSPDSRTPRALACGALLVGGLAFLCLRAAGPRGPRTVVAPVGQPASALARTAQRIELAHGPLELVFEDHGAGAEALERIRAATRLALPCVEAAAGFSYAGPDPLSIHVHAEAAGTGHYGGYFGEDGLHIGARASEETLVHELAHGWFHHNFTRTDRSENRWLNEGLAELATVSVLRRERALGDPVRAHGVRIQRLFEGEGSTMAGALASWAPPFPLSHGSGPAPWLEVKRSEWYARAYGFFHLVSCYVREDDLASFHAELVAAGRPVDGDDYVQRLVGRFPALRGIESGWVRPGLRAARFDLELLRDDDGDGLSAAEELALGLSPDEWDSDGDGFGDGQELISGRTDPRESRASPWSGLRYSIDANLIDWWRAPRWTGGDFVIDTDRIDAVPAPGDLLVFAIDADGRYVYLAFQFRDADELVAPDAHVFFDTNQDGEPDWAVSVDARGRVWGGELRAVLEGAPLAPLPGASVARQGARIELAVPRRSLPRALVGRVVVQAWASLSLPLGGLSIWSDSSSLREIELEPRTDLAGR